MRFGQADRASERGRERTVASGADRMDEAVPAWLYVGRHGGQRVRTSFDCGARNRLPAKGVLYEAAATLT